MTKYHFISCPFSIHVYKCINCMNCCMIIIIIMNYCIVALIIVVYLNAE